TPQVSILTKRPVRPGPSEVQANPMARSAKLRAVERLSDD
ncbi:MAG: 16S rRNA (cytosine(1402)-N(4))-methyltransferase, partial [Deltaproteobacteria bacterium]|nr:16S rRNA (cytosine(1402)-N(4))-methyltransferase [Deltaproteobacteria bacterium]